jgi:hypothetical protein
MGKQWGHRFYDTGLARMAGPFKTWYAAVWLCRASSASRQRRPVLASSGLRQYVLFPIFSYLIEIEHFEAADRLYHNCLTVPCDNPKAVSRLSP